MIWFSLVKSSPENNSFLNTGSDFTRILVFVPGPLSSVEKEVHINTIAACVNVLFIHLRTMTGLVRKNIALPLSLICGGMSTVHTQNTSFNPNSIRLFRIYGRAGLQLLE